MSSVNPQIKAKIVCVLSANEKNRTNTEYDIVEATISSISSTGSVTCKDDEGITRSLWAGSYYKFLHKNNKTTLSIREYKMSKSQNKNKRIDDANNKFVHVVDDKYYKVKFGEDNKIILTDELDETLETIDSDSDDDEEEDDADSKSKKLRKEDNSDDDSTDDEEEGKKDELDRREAELDTREAALKKELDKQKRSERKRKRNSEDSDSDDEDDEDHTEKKKLKQQIAQQAEQIKQQDEQIKQQCEEMKQLEAKLQQEREQFQNIPNKQALLQLSTQNPELFAAYVTCMTGGFDSNNGSGDDNRNAEEKMEALGYKGQPLRQVLVHISEKLKEQKYEYLDRILLQ